MFVQEASLRIVWPTFPNLSAQQTPAEFVVEFSLLKKNLIAST